jgi:hypothetical protein
VEHAEPTHRTRVSLPPRVVASTWRRGARAREGTLLCVASTSHAHEGCRGACVGMHQGDTLQHLCIVTHLLGVPTSKSVGRRAVAAVLLLAIVEQDATQGRTSLEGAAAAAVARMAA